MNDSITDSILGKSLSDIQSGMDFGANAIKGTLKYISGWTAFDSDPDINTGNFLAFKSTLANADRITVQLIGGTVTTSPIELDADGIAVFHITDKNSQMVQVVAYKDDLIQSRLFSLRGLTCETE